jgi:hypothetical protein
MSLRSSAFASVLSRPAIKQALDNLTEHGFTDGWDRHPSGRYWRVRIGERAGAPSATPWFSQSQISAWIDGARTMGAAI